GKALAGKRNQVVLATKFGQMFDEAAKQGTGYNVTPEYVRQACDASLRRLQIDVIDLYQLHVKEADAAQAKIVRDVLEDLVAAGKIRWYGWSTDEVESAHIFAAGKHCAAIQQRFNIFEGAVETLRVCEENNLASINRNPLAMGALTGKFTTATKFPDDDIRSHRYDFQGKDAAMLKKLDRVRAILTADGRSLAQAALGWLLARSDRMIPIPGFKTIAQVEDNAGVLRRGALTDAQLKEIAEILNDK
ncbi:MAG: aldo/keto reductase, partial [Anaerolineales bacterium]|nr:aldo/keto reductase [Anaerolineales bacterium]